MDHSSHRCRRSKPCGPSRPRHARQLLGGGRRPQPHAWRRQPADRQAGTLAGREAVRPRQARGVALTPRGSGSASADQRGLRADCRQLRPLGRAARRGRGPPDLDPVSQRAVADAAPARARERRSASAHRARGRAPQHRPRRGGHRSGDPLRPRQPAGPGLGPPVRGALLSDRLACAR